MKKALLSLLVIAYAMTGGAGTLGQPFNGSETFWVQDWNTFASSDCASNGYIGNMDNNKFIYTNFNSAPSFSATERAVIINSSSSLHASSMPGWNGFLYDDGVYCNFIRNKGGVNLSGSGSGKLFITAKASENSAVLRIYLGSTGTLGWSPETSTYNTGAGSSIIAEFTLTTSYQTYTFDYEAADPAAWAAWAGKSSVNQWGFDPQTTNTAYYIQNISIGNIPTPIINTVNTNTIDIYPNPATTEVTIDFNGMDLNGAVARLINANGIVVYEGPISSTFSVAGYPKGVYMLQVTSDNKVASNKLVIQ